MNAGVRDENPGFRGNRPRSVLELRDWHRRSLSEPALDPELPIVDAHHHLYGVVTDGQHYRVEDLAQDLASGHRVIGTVYVEAFGSGWYPGGPPSRRSIGEVEMIVRESANPVRCEHGACQLAAAIVSNVDLTLGDEVAALLEAHVLAGQGRMRGVRHHATRDEGWIGRFTHNAPRHLLADKHFRQGFAWLERSGLSFDALVFHTQLAELADLADAFPYTPIILNHVGTLIGVPEYGVSRATLLAEWERGLRALAARPNVSVKIGGMGMPLFGFGFENADKPANSGELAQAWQPFIEVCVDAFGPQRCMFEGNFPIDKQSCGYTELWNAFKLSTRGCSHDERSALFYRTACRAYRLPELECLGDER
ncbi:putative metal-dependent hydrolase of the TIM-barrel fold protein (plasmid) [Variovorax sp. SRS16]|uniref:amidohydrolase family protein n=1 Tax=Variovorax sp. SRS16 TaxID=282217 RepID=UPI001317F324|nr:amidohydrolase family protein [Variovorax sp. SRS16]VTU45372.1 putative metal-dependent hydrolase of the TIM-barrel fold protein [Variovorax sp. SRS16]